VAHLRRGERLCGGDSAKSPCEDDRWRSVAAGRRTGAAMDQGGIMAWWRTAGEM